MDLRLEVVVVPVADVDRAEAFYTERLGFRLDADYPVDADYRVVQVTPPGSECSIIFGTGVTSAAPGTLHGLHLIVSDIEKTVAELTARGVVVDGPFRDVTGVFHRAGAVGRVAGPHPDRASYGSFAAFTDPDGNGWFLQEVTQRAPGR
ncbi:VOC family protein [Nocardia beijingensis]|uniref:VOC family protein n=1 Tax=Nocardia beijingensis TaxID=95162 RepID=UPI001E40581D|nr:VOC family protein [Nocardia beijingensis]